ncbi:MAG: hypothetical protein WB974_15075 [Acidobacteriaceae bacterium]
MKQLDGKPASAEQVAAASASTTKAQTKPERPTIQSFDRFRGVVDGAPCTCKNGHITEAAARKCVLPPKKDREAHPVTVETMPRYACTTGDHKYGHRTEQDALACAGFKSPKTAATKAAAEKPAAAKTTATKGATASKPSAPAKARLRSASAGQIARA